MGMDSHRIVEAFYIAEYDWLRFMIVHDLMHSLLRSECHDSMHALSHGVPFFEWLLTIPSVAFLYASSSLCHIYALKDNIRIHGSGNAPSYVLAAVEVHDNNGNI